MREQLGLRDTHFANPIGLDAADNYSTAARPAKLAVVLRRNDFARETMDRRRATLQTGSRERTRDQPQHARPGVPVGQRGEDGPHELSAGYLLVGSATRDGITVVSVGHGRAQRGRPRRRFADAAALRPEQLRAPDRAAEGRGARAGPSSRTATSSVDLVASSAVRAVVRRGQRFSVSVQDVPSELRGPIPAGARLGTAVVRLGGRVVGARAAPHGGAGQRGCRSPTASRTRTAP